MLRRHLVSQIGFDPIRPDNNIPGYPFPGMKLHARREIGRRTDNSRVSSNGDIFRPYRLKQDTLQVAAMDDCKGSVILFSDLHTH